jgi:hypothetical protein
MRSEKLNIKSRIVSRLEVPMQSFLAAPTSQPIRGWVIDLDASAADFALTLNGTEIPFRRLRRPDLERGYSTVRPERMFGFEAFAALPAGVAEARVALHASLPSGESMTLLEEAFPVRVRPEAAAEFEALGIEVLQPWDFSPPADEGFQGRFAIIASSPADGPDFATPVLAAFGRLLVRLANQHALFLAVFSYAADRFGNIAASQLDLGRVQKDALQAISSWLVAAVGRNGTVPLFGLAGETLVPVLRRLFPRATVAKSETAEITQAPVAAPVLSREWPVYPDERPIFVVGAGRSGTSVVTSILLDGRYPGFQEGHVFPYLKQQLDVVADAWADVKTGAAHIPPPEKSVFERGLVEMVADAARKDPASTRWIDKTPDAPMLELVPMLQRLYPNAQYLYMRRHPASLAESRRRKFHEPLETALAQWRKCETLWAEARAAVPSGAFREFDQADFSLRTGATLRELFAFLEPGDDAKFRMLRGARRSRPENTMEIGAREEQSMRREFLHRQLLDALPVSLSAMGWPADALHFYDRECRALAEEMGYSSEPSRDRMRRDLRDVSVEIHEAEECLMTRACEKARDRGIVDAFGLLLRALRKRFFPVS